MGRMRKLSWLGGSLLLAALALGTGCDHPADLYYDKGSDFPPEPRMTSVPTTQSDEDVLKKSAGCMSCHVGIENPSMHASEAVKIGCADCHGGNGQATTKEEAHVQARGPWYHIGHHGLVGPKHDDHGSAHAEPAAHAAPADHAAKTGDAHGEHAKTEEAHGAAHGDTPAAHGSHGSHGAHGGQHPSAWPKRTGAVWMKEDPEFIRFINPGDLRVAKFTCGGCHPGYFERVSTSMMAHGGMLWNAALYNNGASNQKYGRYGEAYMWDGKPARIQSLKQNKDSGKWEVFRPTNDDIKNRGILPYLDPLPRYNITQSGNVLRAFERGGRVLLETAQPIGQITPGKVEIDESGKPELKLSIRGFGTLLSTDPVFLGLQKTRLLDPILWHPGTNDQAGDYRSSGCSSCHVIYANDRDPSHSGPYAKYGKSGHSFSKDATLAHVAGKENDKGEVVEKGKSSGHPIKHVFTRSIPSSQCVVCHMHPGTTVTVTYYGNTWYDNETEGSKTYLDSHLPNMSEREELKIKYRNPEAAALRGRWGDVEWMESVWERNDQFKQIQFADYHGHGWLYKNVYKMDRKGNLLDKDGKQVAHDAPNKFKKGEKGEPLAGSAVHMQDIHLEKGMHCIDCHFNIDNHGNGLLYTEVRNATEITCADCHGTIYKRATLKTTGNAAPEGGTDLAASNTPFGKRFRVLGGKLMQQSAVDANVKWEVPQVIDTITPGNPHYNEKARLAKTMRKDNKTWGDVPEDPSVLAHKTEKMDCYTCHTSWMASCFGCHLPMRANQNRDNIHYEGAHSRNWTQYNWQTLRGDVFMLGLDGTVKGNKVAPVRSACAVIVGSQNAQREWIYSQQQTVSAEGFSGQAFSPHYPHAVRGAGETKMCVDCHVSKAGDNNAWMSQVLMLGTNTTNFMYRYVYVACDDGGTHAVVVTEQDEPQAVIGSTLHRDAFRERYAEHLERDMSLEHEYGKYGTVKQLQLRGEYLYAARGGGGVTIYDVANIDNKGFSQRISTAPVSPLGQRMYVKSKDCTQVISPTVLGVDPTRQVPFMPRDPLNQEQGIHPIYAFLYCLDREEGLFTINAATLLDGDPTNNFLERHLTFNPNGVLTGSTHGIVAGTNLWVCSDAGLVCVDISKIGTELVEAALKMNPDGKKKLEIKKVVEEARAPNPDELKVLSVVPLNKPRAVRIQFRYAFVLDADGLKVIDITHPDKPRLVEGATVPFQNAHSLYLARTYAYVAAGAEGLAIVDIEHAEAPKLFTKFTGDGWLNDVRDVKLGMTNTSSFAYLANGKRGLAVVQLTSPETVPNFEGWSPEPKPFLIAKKDLPGVALNISEGLQRDRAVDESGNQLSVFNRVGSRPFNKKEMEAMYMLDGQFFSVANEPPGEPLEMKAAGGGTAELEAKLEALKADLEKEKNPIKKRKIQKDIEDLEKKIKEASAGANAEKIKELEAALANEKNPIKKRKIEQELKKLKGE
ncbi:MAG: hypothetical protein HS116_16445 [Planctomycetes bacterium]|nr:hypothetical protein [Planctomycetota bacterium]